MSIYTVKTVAHACTDYGPVLEQNIGKKQSSDLK